jgi:hypothetical protein
VALEARAIQILDAQADALLVSDLTNRHVDGLLIGTAFPPSAFGPITLPGRPIVLIDRSVPIPGYAAVGANSREGARALVDHLVSGDPNKSWTIEQLAIWGGIGGSTVSCRSFGRIPEWTVSREHLSEEGHIYWFVEDGHVEFDAHHPVIRGGHRDDRYVAIRRVLA